MTHTAECPSCWRKLRVTTQREHNEERLANAALAESCPRNKPNRVGCPVADALAKQAEPAAA